MTKYLVLFLTVLLACGGCASFNKKKKAKKEMADRTTPELREEATDVEFQSFVGRLKQAAAAKDMATLSQMMTPDFAYVLGNSPAEDKKGDGVFKYWDENGLWPEIEGILSEKFVSSGGYMVAPPQFVNNPEHYQGYRAGIKRVGDAWKFVYFVNGQPSLTP